LTTVAARVAQDRVGSLTQFIQVLETVTRRPRNDFSDSPIATLNGAQAPAGAARMARSLTFENQSRAMQWPAPESFGLTLSEITTLEHPEKRIASMLVGAAGAVGAVSSFTFTRLNGDGILDSLGFARLGFIVFTTVVSSLAIGWAEGSIGDFSAWRITRP